MPNGIETGAFPFWHGRQGRTRLDDDAGPIFLRSADSGFVRQNDGQMARFDGLLAWNPNPSTGVEGRISALKHGYGWDRTRIDGTEGAQIWVGHGVMAHNLVKISTLAA